MSNNLRDIKEFKSIQTEVNSAYLIQNNNEESALWVMQIWFHYGKNWWNNNNNSSFVISMVSSPFDGILTKPARND